MKNLMHSSTSIRLTVFIIMFVLIDLLAPAISPANAQSDTQPASVYWFDWSNDGATVAVATSEGVSVYDSEFRLLLSRPQPDSTRSRSFGSISPDGSRFATEKEIWDTQTLKTLLQLNTIYPLGDWNRDGTLISTVGPDMRSIVFYDTKTGNIVKTISTGDVVLTFNPIWSPDNTRFASVEGKRTLILIDASNGQILSRYSHEDLINPVISWSHNGRYLAYSGFAEPKLGETGNPIQYSIYVTDTTDGKIIYTFNGLSNTVSQLIWSPDDTQVGAVIGSDQINIWDTKGGQLINQYQTLGGLIRADYSPFGGQIMMGFNLYWYKSSSEFSVQSASRSFLNGAVQIVVPAPSAEKLQAITQACGVQPGVQQSLTAQITTNKLQDFTTQVSALTDTQIPPGCKADLLAVVNALMAKGQ